MGELTRKQREDLDHWKPPKLPKPRARPIERRHAWVGMAALLIALLSVVASAWLLEFYKVK